MLWIPGLKVETLLARTDVVLKPDVRVVSRRCDELEWDSQA